MKHSALLEGPTIVAPSPEISGARRVPSASGPSELVELSPEPEGPRARVEREREAALEREANATRLMAAYRDSRERRDFEALYAETERAVHTWILSLLRQGPAHLDAQELLQDTFVNVYRYPSAFRDEQPGSFRVWVRTIAGNLVRRARSRGGRHGLMLELPEGGLEPADERGQSPDAQADLMESARHLSRAWDLFLCAYLVAWQQLAERDAKALELVEVEELCYAEASEKLGVRPANMKMIVFRARKRLATHMRRTLG